MGDLKVHLFFIDITGQPINGALDPADYAACGDPTLAGPFLSSDSAIDWREQFCPEGKCIDGWSDDPNTCSTSPIMYERGGWTRSGG
jgi:hypothetical protein